MSLLHNVVLRNTHERWGITLEGRQANHNQTLPRTNNEGRQGECSYSAVDESDRWQVQVIVDEVQVWAKDGDGRCSAEDLTRLVTMTVTEVALYR